MSGHMQVLCDDTVVPLGCQSDAVTDFAAGK